MFLLTTSCFSGEGCDIDLDACEKDADCGGDAVCDPALFGNVCVPAFECQTDADCDPGERCVQRPPSEPQHPFATDLEGKKVCECSGDECLTTSTTSTSTSTSGGAGGMSAGGGGAGGMSAGGGGAGGMNAGGNAGGMNAGGGGAGGMGGGA